MLMIITASVVAPMVAAGDHLDLILSKIVWVFIRRLPQFALVRQPDSPQALTPSCFVRISTLERGKPGVSVG